MCQCPFLELLNESPNAPLTNHGALNVEIKQLAQLVLRRAQPEVLQLLVERRCFPTTSFR